MTSPLVNHFFLTKDDEGKTQYQGQITEELSSGYFLCQFFEWMTGSPTCKKMGHISGMSTWEFYSDADDWRAAGSRGVS